VDDIDIETVRAELGLPPDPQVAAGGFRFTVDQLRRWAERRRRLPMGQKGGGRFLPEPGAHIDKEPEARIPDIDPYARPPARAVAKKAAPAKKATPAKKAAPARKTAAKKTTAKKAPAKKTATPTGTSIGAFKDITTLDRAQKAANAETSKVETRYKNTVKAEQTIKDNIQEALANPDAEPHLKTAAREASSTIAEHRAAADKALKAAQDAREKAGAATDLDEALRHAADASAKIAEADAALEAAEQAAKDVTTAAKAKPRPPFENAAARTEFNSPPSTHRKATIEEERSELGNSPTWSGMWVAKNADDTRPRIRFRPTGSKGTLYSPLHHLLAERMKWKRVEKLRKVAPDIEDSLEKIMGGAGGTGTDLQKQRLRDNAFSLLLSMHTGMRPSDPGTKSEIKDKNGNKVVVPTYGSSTLQKRHVEKINRRPDGTLSSIYLKFHGKSGVENRIKVTDPELMEEIAKRYNDIKGPVRVQKRGETRMTTIPEKERELSPVAKSGYMNKMLQETAQQVMTKLGLNEQVEMGDLNADESEGADPMAEVTGPFTNRTLRTLFANSIGPEIFAQMVKRGGVPKTKEKFDAYIQEVAKQTSERLGNGQGVLLKNYLSALPFLQWMPQGTKADGTPEWEDWWQYGKKMVTKPE
jgi:hypothetical protein